MSSVEEDTRKRGRSLSSPLLIAFGNMFDWEDQIAAELCVDLDDDNDNPLFIESAPRSSTQGISIEKRRKPPHGSELEVKTENSNIQRELFRVQLPNKSHRTFQVTKETTSGEISEKIISKLSIEYPDADYSTSKIYQVFPDGNEILLQKHVILYDILEQTDEKCHYVFKKEGEKVIDQEEIVKALENKMAEQRKENIDDAFSKWLGDSSKQNIARYQEEMASAAFQICESRFFPTFFASCLEKDSLFTQIDILSGFLLEKESEQRRLYQLKKSKNKSTCFIDFSSSIDVLSSFGVSLSNISEIVWNEVIISGWKCTLKEYIIHPDDSDFYKKAIFETTLLEGLPYHPNIIQYFHHMQTDAGVRLFYNSCGISLSQFVNDYLGKAKENLNFGFTSSFNDLPVYVSKGQTMEKNSMFEKVHSQIPRYLVRKLLLGIIEGVEFLHSFGVVHLNLTPDNIYLNWDSEKEDVTSVKIGNFFNSLQVKDSNEFIENQPNTKDLNRFHAPECVNSSCGLQSDIYSIGMIYNFLLTGERPFSSVESREDFFKISSRRELRLGKLKCCLSANLVFRPSAWQLKQIIWNLPVK